MSALPRTSGPVARLSATAAVFLDVQDTNGSGDAGFLGWGYQQFLVFLHLSQTGASADGRVATYQH